MDGGPGTECEVTVTLVPLLLKRRLTRLARAPSAGGGQVVGARRPDRGPLLSTPRPWTPGSPSLEDAPASQASKASESPHGARVGVRPGARRRDLSPGEVGTEGVRRSSGAVRGGRGDPGGSSASGTVGADRDPRPSTLGRSQDEHGGPRVGAQTRGACGVGGAGLPTTTRAQDEAATAGKDNGFDLGLETYPKQKPRGGARGSFVTHSVLLHAQSAWEGQSAPGRRRSLGSDAVGPSERFGARSDCAERFCTPSGTRLL